MTVAAPYPPVELAVCDFLADLGTCGTETPAATETELPYIRVNRTGGADDRITDEATVSVDVFDANRSDALALAETIRARLTMQLPATTGHGTLDFAATAVAPGQSPPTDTDNLRLAVASYRITLRRDR